MGHKLQRSYVLFFRHFAVTYISFRTTLIVYVTLLLIKYVSENSVFPTESFPFVFEIQNAI